QPRVDRKGHRFSKTAAVYSRLAAPLRAALNPRARSAGIADERSTYLRQCLDRRRAGDESARQELLAGACARLAELTRTMLKDYRRLKRWEQTDDVLQNALVRLHRSLQDVTPPSLRDFYRLAALQVRRELIDLARHYFGPQGRGRRHQTNAA